VDTDRLKVIQMISTNYGISTLLWDESNLWAGSQFSTSVQKVDPVQGIVTQNITLQYGLVGIASGSGSLWAAETDDNQAEGPGTGLLEQIDPQTGKVARQVPLDFAPRSIAATQAGVWVTGPGLVYQYEASSGNLLAEVEVEGSPNLLFSDGDSLWATYRFRRGLVQIDPQRAQFISRRVDQSAQDMAFDGLNLWVVACPYEGTCWVQKLTPSAETINDVPVSLTWDGSQLWITEGRYSGYGGVQRFDPETGQFSPVIPLRGTPSAAAWDGRSLWVADFEGGVVQHIDPTQMAVAGEVRVGDHPVDLAWNGTSLWVCSMGGSVSEIDPQTEQVLAQIPVGVSPTDILWLGGSIWVASEAGVHKIDPQSQVVETFPLGGDTNSISWSGEALWVQLASGNLLELDPSSGAILSSQPACEWKFDWPVEKCTALPEEALTSGASCYLKNAAWDGDTFWAFCAWAAVGQIDPHTHQITSVIAIEDPQALAWDGAHLWVANRTTLQRIDVHVFAQLALK
jgi:YVTN family beta-propeller protein